MMDPTRFVRPDVAAMTGYVPGEQPVASGRLIKLNTNENPSEPPAVILQALARGLETGFRRYPDPGALRLRETACGVYGYGLTPDRVVVGNGSDDLLTMIMRTFVDPGDLVAVPGPTYTLYSALTRIQGGIFREIDWNADGGLPVEKLVSLGPKLVLVVRPNAPTGHCVALEEVARLCRSLRGMVVLDEAYVDFADGHGLGLLADHPNLVIIRTFSKSMAMAALRIGLGFMDSRIAREFHKVRDSYNVNAYSQWAARVALDHHGAYRPIWDEIRSQRSRLTLALRSRRFDVPESQANFILARVPTGGMSGGEWLERLKKQGIHVRHFPADPRLADRLRITIGSGEEIDRLLEVVDALATEGERS
ncbi:MAG: histidinol-phosphate transaminase [Magnetococcales bacterium]|nr:histidinol-phosphate transaminase [Magnetococcales bacterium]